MAPLKVRTNRTVFFRVFRVHTKSNIYIYYFLYALQHPNKKTVLLVRTSRGSICFVLLPL